jgi:hypothetical protein
LASRSWGILLGSIVMVAIPATIITPRLAPVLLLVLLVACVAANGAQTGEIIPRDIVAHPVVAFLGLVLLYACGSALWSARPLLTLEKSGFALACAAGALVIARTFSGQSRPNNLHLAEGLWIGLIVGVSYFAAELLSGLSMRRWVLNALNAGDGGIVSPRFAQWQDGKLVGLLMAELTRNATPLSLLAWPATMAALGGLRRPWNLIISIGVFGAVAAAIMVSPQETSKLAILVGLTSFGLALTSRATARRLLAFGWITICLGVLPAALFAYGLGLHHLSWLPWSGQHRIVIWNTVARHALETPVLGIGAGMTSASGLRVLTADAGFPENLAHAHNVFLQIWLELGALGALLLCGFGLAVIAAAARLPGLTSAFAFALISSATIVAAMSYDLWSPWFVATLALCLSLFPIGAVCLQGPRHDAGDWSNAGRRLTRLSTPDEDAADVAQRP